MYKLIFWMTQRYTTCRDKRVGYLKTGVSFCLSLFYLFLCWVFSCDATRCPCPRAMLRALPWRSFRVKGLEVFGFWVLKFRV
jgi:hypothetical protein